MSSLREDITGARQLRFRVDGEGLHLFKPKGEALQQVYLKVALYALYAPRYPLTFAPRIACKFQPDVASVDLMGDVLMWGQCGETPIDQLTYILKHSDAREVVLAREAIDLSAYVGQLKRHLHYRYTTGKLRVLAFSPLDEWFDPDHVHIPQEAYESHEF